MVPLAQRRNLWPVIVETYARTGRLEAAAAAADVTGQTVRNLIKRDRNFAAAMDEARGLYAAKLRAEVTRRGIEGVTKPLIYKGKVVTTVQEYSDPLLTLALRLSDPEVREMMAPKSAASITVNASASAQAAALAQTHAGDASDGPTIDLRRLTREQRDALRQLRQARTLAQGVPETALPAAGQTIEAPYLEAPGLAQGDPEP
jgi:hypothetical protein